MQPRAGKTTVEKNEDTTSVQDGQISADTLEMILKSPAAAKRLLDKKVLNAAGE